MGKPKKKGTYEHFCVLIIAQGIWSEKYVESIRKPLIERYNMITDNPYHFYNKLTRRLEMPSYSDCNICGPIYDMLKKIQGTIDGILYQGHHYLIPEDDMEDMKAFANLILSNHIVKKLYILYLDDFSEMERNKLKSWNLNEIKKHIKVNKLNISQFESVIDEKKFENRTLYEITKLW